MHSNAVLERHPDLYFQDGDIVLAVKQTDATHGFTDDPVKYTVFRVHKFLLKHHSATFANFFADANAAPAEVYDGVPLAEMHGDKAEDFALLLSYLYNPSSLVFKRNDPSTPLAISGSVRLADKYLIEPLHRCLVQQVCDDWPATLYDYDLRQAEIESLRELSLCNPDFEYSAGALRGGRISDIMPEPASAVMFAQEFGCPQILPAAFYRLSLIPRYSARPAARWSILDKDSLLRCMYGSQALKQYRPSIGAFMCEQCFEDSCFNEDMDSPCFDFIERLFDIMFERLHPTTHADPLGFLLRCLDFRKMHELSKEYFPDGLCRECEVTLREGIIEERKKIWAKLPQWFKFE
ncbi:hypothetical protein V8D89_000394 [Ganoderma adspersum]